ncbi:hypothetical protein J2S43_003833 [Catenuloplanes nepalensis]|uniref:Uncharacterized protein n=1 Tax=Catenuloplanes nepalensis TaxID=587533 RepID=A0ABT9MWE2_9ACTN|nr:hypothetical protein [Catenuloplanes nepalensis]MDP9795321.1 hypothetical protein [Catenuloplanes nepalensis]
MLAEWRDDLMAGYLTLTDEVPDDALLNFEAASLPVVAALVLDPGFDEELIPAVAAYLGETLLRTAGGRWEWDEAPLAVPGDGLGLEPVAPMTLIDQVRDAGDASPLTSVHEEWAAAVAGAGARPEKEETDLDWVSPAETAAALSAWAAARRDRFGDPTPESLDRVEDAVRGAPGDRALFEDAVRHVGEVFRRGHGGRWTIDSAGPVDADTVYLRLVGPSRARVTPALLLAASREQPGHLRRYYAS